MKTTQKCGVVLLCALLNLKGVQPVQAQTSTQGKYYTPIEKDINRQSSESVNWWDELVAWWKQVTNTEQPITTRPGNNAIYSGGQP